MAQKPWKYGEVYATKPSDSNFKSVRRRSTHMDKRRWTLGFNGYLMVFSLASTKRTRGAEPVVADDIGYNLGGHYRCGRPYLVLARNPCKLFVQGVEHFRGWTRSDFSFFFYPLASLLHLDRHFAHRGRGLVETPKIDLNCKTFR